MMNRSTESLTSSEAKRLADKYDHDLENTVRQWISQVLGQQFDASASLCDILKSGVIICELLNTIKPGTITNIYKGSLPFRQMENISRYIEECKSLGMPNSSIFQTVDLYEGKEPAQVLNNVNYLSHLANSFPSFKGPFLKEGKICTSNAISDSSLNSQKKSSSIPSLSPVSKTTSVPSTNLNQQQVNQPQVTKSNSYRISNPNRVQSQQQQGPKVGNTSTRGLSPNRFLPTSSPTPSNYGQPVPNRAVSPNRFLPPTSSSPSNYGQSVPTPGRSPGASHKQSAPPRGQPVSNRGQPVPTRGQPTPARGQSVSNRGQSPSPNQPSVVQNQPNRGQPAQALSPRGRAAPRARGGRGILRGIRGRRPRRGGLSPRSTDQTTSQPQNTPEQVDSSDSSNSKKKLVFNATIQFNSNNKSASSKNSSEKSKTQKVASVSSLEEDIATKQMFKYDPEMEQTAVEWLEAVSGKRKVGTLAEWLHDGVILCNVLNTLRPGTVKPPSESKISFKHRENIAEYLEGCQTAFGLKPTTLFQTVDLYEEKNMNLVITSIHVLAKEAAKQPGYSGPRIKEVVASANYALYSVSFVSGLPPIQNESTISSEESSMLDWLNSHLSKLQLNANRVSSDLRNGVLIINVLQLLTGVSRLGTYVKSPSNLWHCMQNAALILVFIQQQTGERVPGCKASDITWGLLNPLLSLLRFIRSKFDRDYIFKAQNLTEDSCRIKILEELLDTERTYTSQMREIKEKIMDPIIEKEALPTEEVWNVFGNIEDILKFSQTMLDELEVLMASGEIQPKFSHIFLSRSDNEFISLYSSYINNFDMASLMVKYNKKHYRNFKKIIKAFEKQKNEGSGLDLDSYLIVPVQRLPRYLLLLKELHKYTHESHEDFHGINQAITHMEQILQTINENKREADTANTSHKLLTIDKSMVYEVEDFEGIVHPKRSYIYEGVLNWDEMEEEAEHPYWFLFNDIIVFCSDLSDTPDAPPDKQFRYITLMPLKFMDDFTDNADNPCAFDISMEDEVITLEADSEENKKIWLEKIRAAKALNIDLDLVW